MADINFNNQMTAQDLQNEQMRQYQQKNLAELNAQQAAPYENFQQAEQNRLNQIYASQPSFVTNAQPQQAQGVSQSDAFQSNQVNKNDLVGAKPQQSIQPSVMPSQLSQLPQFGGMGLATTGLKNEMLASQKEAQIKANYYQDLEKNNAKVDQEYQQKLQQQQDKINQATNKFEQIQNDISQNVKVNPNRYMQNLSTGQSVAAYISVALGGLATAFAGGENKALQMLQNSIDKDIRAQEIEIQNKKEGLSAQNNLINMYNKQLGDMEAAKAMAKRDLYQVAELKLNQQYNSLSGPAQLRAQAEYQKNIGMLQAKQQESQQVAMKNYLEKSVQNKAYSGELLSAQDVSSLPENDRKNVVRVGDKYAIATGSKEKDLLAEKLPAMVSYKEKSKMALELMDKAGTKSWNRDEIGKIKTVMSDMATSYSKLKGLGSYDNGTADLIKQVQGDPTSFFSMSSTDKAKIKQAQELVNSEMQNLLKQSTIGYQGVK